MGLGNALTDGSTDDWRSMKQSDLEKAAERSLERLQGYPPGVLGPAARRLLKGIEDKDA